MSEQSGENLDFSPESLRALDGLLSEWLDPAHVYGGEGTAEALAMAIPAAAYVGETLIRGLSHHNINARWVIDEQAEHMSGPHLLIGHGLRVNVIKKAVEIFRGVDRPSFAAYFDTVSRLAGVEPDFDTGSHPEP